MQTNKFSIHKLNKYHHQAVLLFRGIELKILSLVLSDYRFKKPSMDLGSGDGYISSVIFKESFTYGVDNDEAGDTQIAIKKKRYKKVLIESAVDMSLGSESLRFVFSNSVIEHIPNNHKVLKEVSRILSPGGYFVFTCPSVFFTRYLSEKHGETYAKIRNKHLNHYHLLDHTEWKRRLDKNGLKMLEYHYYMTKNDLLFWDKLVWLSKVISIFGPIGDKVMISLFNRRVKSLVAQSTTNQSEGANILIIATK